MVAMVLSNERLGFVNVARYYFKAGLRVVHATT